MTFRDIVPVSRAVQVIGNEALELITGRSQLPMSNVFLSDKTLKGPTVSVGVVVLRNITVSAVSTTTDCIALNIPKAFQTFYIYS